MRHNCKFKLKAVGYAEKYNFAKLVVVVHQKGRYSDEHGSNLAGVFINLEAIYIPMFRYTHYIATTQFVGFSLKRRMALQMEGH